MLCQINIKNIQYADGKMVPASKFGQADASESLELTDEEKEMKEKLQAAWSGILNKEIEDDTDFFKSGAGSMDVVRSVISLNLQICIFNIYGCLI